MKRISAYQATDGEVFKDRIECKAWQHDIDVRQSVETVVFHNVRSESHLDNVEIAQFIMDNRDMLLHALEGAIVEYGDTIEMQVKSASLGETLN